MSQGSAPAASANVIAPRLFQYGIFPVVMTAAVAIAWWLMGNGVEPALAILGPQFGGFIVVAIFEHIYPYHRSWNISRADIRVDATHAVSIAVLLGLVTPLLTATGVVIGGYLSAEYGASIWPHEWPLLLQIVMVLLIGEIPGYWIHRWEHQWDFLWRFHAVHHSAPRLYWLNAGRFHPIDSLLTFVPSLMLLVALGASEMLLAYFTLITALHGIFQHGNLQLRLGPLNWFFSMAELHRWHHSRTIVESNSNYGQTVSVWDWVFGTRHLPADKAPPEDIGMTGLAAFPMTWWAQIVAPLRWRRIKADSETPQA
ncbi:sterol desaturase family protein [Candidatus Litorirhabdus singularis]|uniref:sterol desaturase family protein n=1 Tax=Candidatus Litorirhabdus singularis TaxID=2518993 RepID=UPI0024300044|nr:sterol desaturase family protein [Candidatus Litorirhabdus singularis]